MGNKTKSEREGFFCLKIFCRCKKAGNLIIKRPEGDYLEQSELGFGIFFADGHTDKQMIRTFNTMVRRLFYG
jgi:hypothetical protein